MNGARTRLLAVNSSFPRADSVLRFLEPSGTSANSLWERLFAGSYDKPFIIDSGPWRSLHFDLEAVQSAMSLKAVDKLCLPYTRKMMAFLLFNPEPARILMLGLGGGSLAKFCYRHLPRTALTAVELNADVIRLREEFNVPRDDLRFRVVCADGARYVSRLKRRKDVILADACDRIGVAPELNGLEFYQEARRCLSPDGVLVINLCGDVENCNAHLRQIHKVFEGRFVTLQVMPHGNRIVLAFNWRRPEFDWEKIATGATALQGRFELDFPKYVRRMTLDWKLGRRQY